MRRGRDQAARRRPPRLAHSASAAGWWLRHARRDGRRPRRVIGRAARKWRCAAPSWPRVHSIATCASAFMVSAMDAHRVVMIAAHGDGAPAATSSIAVSTDPVRIGAIADDSRRAGRSARRRWRAPRSGTPRTPAGWRGCRRRSRSAQHGPGVRLNAAAIASRRVGPLSNGPARDDAGLFPAGGRRRHKKL